MTPFNFVMTIDENVRILDTLKVGVMPALADKSWSCPHSSASSDRSKEAAYLLMHHKKRLLLLKLTKKKICRTTAKYLDHIWMQYGIQSLQLPLATFQKVIMQHRTSINFLLQPFLKSRHTSRNLGKIMEQSIKQALPENDFSTKEIDHVWKITI